MTFTEQFLAEAAEILKQIDVAAVERVAATLAACRDGGGRLFILGVGGSAANASHAVNDFRKICGIEAYAPTDNVSELTARTNDEGWAGVFEGWLRVSRLRAQDALLIFSVGGGNLEKQVSPNLVAAIRYAKVGRRESHRDRGTRWRLHGAERRCLRDRADRQCEACDAARGSVSGRNLAPAGDASGAQAGGDQVGIGKVTKAVFLDRDGVLNHSIVREGLPYPTGLDDLAIYADAAGALDRLKQAGYLLIVVTNQPDIARGTVTRATVDAINAVLGAALPVDEFVVCAHDDAAALLVPQAEARDGAGCGGAARGGPAGELPDRRPLARCGLRRVRRRTHRADRPRVSRAGPRSRPGFYRRLAGRRRGLDSAKIGFCKDRRYGFFGVKRSDAELIQ